MSVIGDPILMMGLKPKYTYTGSHEFIDDGGPNWRIKLKSSGTLTFTVPGNITKGIDIFVVGGGAGGARAKNSTSNTIRTYGGGGYTKTQSNVAVTKGTGYAVTIGGGGAGVGPNGGAVVYSTAGSQSKIVIGGTTYSANGGGRCDAQVVDWDYTYEYKTTPGTGGSAVGEFGVSGSAYSGHKSSGDTAGGANTGTGGYGSAAGGSGIVVIRNHR